MHAKRVLLVDDDSYSTTQLKKLIETEKLTVDAVSSGQEALSALTANDYSVLITDLKMPGMGGMELIREVALRRIMVTTIVTTSFGGGVIAARRPTAPTRAANTPMVANTAASTAALSAAATPITSSAR